jgi:predicted amidophosphoribosyltransferase
VQRFKFEGDLATGRRLGRLLTNYLASGSERSDCIVPVPLHASRLKVRGFNQAVELARPIATRLKTRVRLDFCERLRATEVQAKPDAVERRKYLRGPFTVTGAVQGLHVALRDDVVTTGTMGDTRRSVQVCAGRARQLIGAYAAPRARSLNRYRLKLSLYLTPQAHL